MFVANSQPSWALMPQTKGTLLFYFLKPYYNLGFYEIFVGSTSSEVKRPWISKIRWEQKKSQKIIFQA